ncbi:MAG: hypothetical protein J1F03_00025, partial [Oscillospiraceae bacterium]|nr:hypothetical protein [Oscillospiraceae bacterium]
MWKYIAGIIIFGLLLCIFGFVLISILLADNYEDAEIITFGIFVIVLVIGLIVNLIKFIRLRNPEKAAKIMAKTVQAQVSGKLVDGLPIPASVI